METAVVAIPVGSYDQADLEPGTDSLLENMDMDLDTEDLRGLPPVDEDGGSLHKCAALVVYACCEWQAEREEGSSVAAILKTWLETKDCGLYVQSCASNKQKLNTIVKFVKMLTDRKSCKPCLWRCKWNVMRQADKTPSWDSLRRKVWSEGFDTKNQPWVAKAELVHELQRLVDERSQTMEECCHQMMEERCDSMKPDGHGPVKLYEPSERIGGKQTSRLRETATLSDTQMSSAAKFVAVGGDEDSPRTPVRGTVSESVDERIEKLEEDVSELQTALWPGQRGKRNRASPEGSTTPGKRQRNNAPDQLWRAAQRSQHESRVTTGADIAYHWPVADGHTRDEDAFEAFSTVELLRDPKHRYTCNECGHITGDMSDELFQSPCPECHTVNQWSVVTGGLVVKPLADSRTPPGMLAVISSREFYYCLANEQSPDVEAVPVCMVGIVPVKCEGPVTGGKTLVCVFEEHEQAASMPSWDLRRTQSARFGRRIVRQQKEDDKERLRDIAENGAVKVGIAMEDSPGKGHPREGAPKCLLSLALSVPDAGARGVAAERRDEQWRTTVKRGSIVQLSADKRLGFVVAMGRETRSAAYIAFLAPDYTSSDLVPGDLPVASMDDTYWPNCWRKFTERGLRKNRVTAIPLDRLRQPDSSTRDRLLQQTTQWAQDAAGKRLMWRMQWGPAACIGLPYLLGVSLTIFAGWYGRSDLMLPLLIAGLALMVCVPSLGFAWVSKGRDEEMWVVKPMCDEAGVSFGFALAVCGGLSLPVVLAETVLVWKQGPRWTQVEGMDFCCFPATGRHETLFGYGPDGDCCYSNCYQPCLHVAECASPYKAGVYTTDLRSGTPYPNCRINITGPDGEQHVATVPVFLQIDLDFLWLGIVTGLCLPVALAEEGIRQWRRWSFIVKLQNDIDRCNAEADSRSSCTSTPPSDLGVPTTQFSIDTATNETLPLLHGEARIYDDAVSTYGSVN